MTPAEQAGADLPRKLEELRRLAFPDVWFTRDDQAGGFSLPLNLRTDALRFSLERPDFLHLGALTLETAEPPFRIAEALNVEVEDINARRHLGGLLQPGYRWISFHSTATRPELVLEFPRATLTRIGLDNRPDSQHHRAWSLRIEARSRSGAWRVVWRHAPREAAFRRAARHLVAPGVPPGLLSLLRRAAMEAMRLDPALAGTLLSLFHRYGVDCQMAARDSLNEAILRPRRREMTAHGIRRTFRFWSQSEQEIALDVLEDARAVLAGAGYEAFLGYGALLGLVREGGLIPHDDDLDLIAIPSAPGPPSLAALAATLEAAGFRTRVASPLHLNVWREAHAFAACDVFLAERDHDCAILYPAREARRPLDSILPLQSGRLLGRPVTLPANPIAMLEALYGADWRRPSPHFSHRWERG